MPSKKTKRHKLLLDECLPPRSSYRQLNNLHDIRHIKHEFNMGGSDDQIVYKKAQSENRIMVVVNTKDFRPLVSSTSPTLICISANLTNKQADLKICKVLKEMKPRETKGHIILLSRSDILKLKVK